MVKKILNRTTARQALRLFDYCFKMGVLDARDVEDDYLVQEWYNTHRPEWSYGLLSAPDAVFTWQRWRHTLYRWCRNTGLRTLGETYIDMMRRRAQSCLFAIIPLTMRFYLMGVEEWLAYPNRANAEVFKMNLYVHWKPMRPASLKLIRTDDYIAYLQDWSYEFRDLPLNVQKNLCKDTFFDSFTQAIWQLTRTLTTYGKIRRGIKAQENI